MSSNNNDSLPSKSCEDAGNFLYVGTLVHCLEQDKITVTNNGVIVVINGKICAIGSSENLVQIARKHGISKDNYKILKDGEFLMPGLIDTHIHAPQYPNAGLGYDKPLLGWLDNYTFPLEAKYSDREFARLVYDSVVKGTLACGTTTACYFSTIHLSGSMALVDSVIKYGQRALIGKVNMNVNHPSYYGETLEDSLRDSENFIKLIHAKKNELIKPVITPRFAVTCDMELMKKLGALAKKYDVHIQTHISENKDEVDLVKKLFPDVRNYADVYDAADLLTCKTILAHGVHLTEEEVKVIAERRSAISHCPISNTCLKSGICYVRNLIQNGVKVGLGTDVSGGCSPSIIEVMKGAILASINLSFVKGKSGDNENCILSYQEAFYLATLGGAKALSLDDKIGNFEVGKEFDALVISFEHCPSQVDLLACHNALELVQKFIYMGDDRNVKRVYVSGKQVKSV